MIRARGGAPLISYARSDETKHYTTLQRPTGHCLERGRARLNSNLVGATSPDKQWPASRV
eukprot:8752463-Lingulodinium_polyedra.AAC.1